MKRRSKPLLPLVISAAVFASLLALHAMTVGTPLSVTTALVLAAPGIIGGLTLLLRWPGVVGLFLATLGGLATLAWQGWMLHPQQDLLTAVSQLWSEAVAELSDATLPLPASSALTWLVAAGALLLWWATTLLAQILEQPAWSIVPLGVPYVIAALLAPADLPLAPFLAVAAGYVAILLSTALPSRLAEVVASRWLVGLAASTLAAVIGVVVTSATPMGAKQPWFAPGTNTPIQLSDPTVDLTRNLTRDTPVDVLTYRASDGQAHYLRTTALTKVTSQGAHLTSMRLSPRGLEGAYEAPGTPLQVDVSMRFPSQYLPAPFAPDRWEAAGEWGFDKNTLSIVGTGSSGVAQTSELDYRVYATVPSADAATIASATAGRDPAGPETLEVPAELSDSLGPLLRTITAGYATDGEKALAIGDYLTSDRFTYTLDSPQTTSSDVISAFLLDTNAGYCVHYATGMAILARMAGIPSRVAVGFTGGSPVGDSYRVTTDNMHTWTELYFEGLGWVPFEPTKGYGTSQEPAAPEPTGAPEPEPTETVATQAPPTPAAAPPSPQPTTAPDQENATQAPLGLVAPIAVVLIVMLAPAVTRMALTWVRLRPGREAHTMANDAWGELAATSRDLGRSWAAGSPVAAVRAMRSDWGRNTSSRLMRIAEAVQRARYAAHAPDLTQLGAQVRQVRREMAAQVSPGRRARAWLWPASLLAVPAWLRRRR